VNSVTGGSRRLQPVHESEWEIERVERFDTIVIGTGQGGVPFATRSAESGRRTLIIERDVLGGTCINRGCTPTKTMVASARAAHVARNVARLGVNVRDVSVDLGAIVDRKEKIVRQWRDGTEKRLSGKDNLVLRRGTARFTAPDRIEVDADVYSGDDVVVNTGARPAIPQIPGLAGVPFLDSTSIMEVRELPRHLVIIGGGYIGCEFGQMFRRFGSDVSIINKQEHLLAREDADVSESIEGVFLDEGIALHLGADVREVSTEGDDVVVTLAGGTRLSGSHLLVAVGRTPNTDDLGCDAAGIETDSRGFIRVDDGYATTADGIYAIGDVTGGPQFTHSSWDDHRILWDILFEGRTDRNRSDRTIPYAVFTDPQVARVGLSEREAKRDGVEYELGSMPFGHVARAIEVDERAGIIKVLVDPSSDRILGAAIVGLEAGELIHVFAVMIEAGASARALVEVEAVHPALAEGLQSALMRIDRYGLKG
jgi:pyruvate/2-oxoglutarate dehydrogenase complex dihydrolipoamide dehydrogenase (E3) component